MAVDQLARVRALLAKAEGTDNPDEAAAYTAKATTLMARHGIDAALAAKTEPATDQRIDKVMTFRAPQAKAQGYLYAKVLGAMRVRVILKGGEYKTLHVFGFKSDLDLAEMMHASLVVQVNRGLATAPLRPANQRGADVRSFIFRFSNVVAVRLRDIYAQTATAAQDELEGGPSVALVLADRKTLVDQAVADVYPRLTTVRTSTSGLAGAAGAEACCCADLGRPVGASSGRALAR